ncbi:MAG: sodium/glutamate symporter [Wenzhouxiangella sp.]
MSADQIGLALILIGVFLLIGKWIRMVTPALQKIFLPSSVIGGLVALLLGPEVLGRLDVPGIESLAGIFPVSTLAVWQALPGLLINVIFASLFIGKTIPGIREIWMLAGPQVSFGQMLAWGQYTFGIALAVLVLTPVFGLPPMAGALIEIGFEGGHGTAAGLADTFEEVGFAEATDLALGLATVGIIAGVVIGVGMVNWAVRAGHTEVLQNPADIPESERTGIVEKSEREPAGYQTTRPGSIDSLSLTVAVIGLAILIGWLLLEALVMLESVTWGTALGYGIHDLCAAFPHGDDRRADPATAVIAF